MDSLTPGQLQVLTFIGRFRQRRGYAPTLAEIAAHLGVIKATVQQYLRALEQKGVITRRRYGHRAIEIVAPERPEALALPLLGQIAAGEPLDAVEDRQTIDLGQVLDLDRDKEMFLLRVKGDSMIEDGIFEGDYVLLEKRPVAQNGDTVVALLPDGVATLKRFFKEKNRIRLQPANAALKPIYVRHVTIQGIVKGVIRALKRS